MTPFGIAYATSAKPVPHTFTSDNANSDDVRRIEEESSDEGITEFSTNRNETDLLKVDDTERPHGSSDDNSHERTTSHEPLTAETTDEKVLEPQKELSMDMNSNSFESSGDSSEQPIIDREFFDLLLGMLCNAAADAWGIYPILPPPSAR